MKNRNVIYYQKLIEKHTKLTKEINVHLGSMLYDAEKSCKFYDYDNSAFELKCKADYVKLNDRGFQVSRENCLDCDNYEPKEEMET